MGQNQKEKSKKENMKETKENEIKKPSKIRESIYLLVQTDKQPTKINRWYNIAMTVIIFISIFPLFFKNSDTYRCFVIIERTTTVIFLLDYIMRWVTADIKYKRFGNKAFYIYPFRFHAVIDLLATLPGLIEMFDVLKLLKLIRVVKCVRVFKALKYSSSFTIISKILHKQKKALLTVCFLAIAYIFISALFVYQIEPETFDTFFDAVYWATISLTTVGYGDIYLQHIPGRLFSMVSAFFGVAFIALPAGIISAGYLQIVMETKGEE